MDTKSNESSKYLTFSQRYGYEPLPNQMRLGEISDDLRREIWNTVRAYVLKGDWSTVGGSYFTSNGERFVERALGRFAKKPESQIPKQIGKISEYFERVIANSKFNRVIDLLEIIIEELEYPVQFSIKIKEIFERNSAAYWLDLSQQPYHFYPIASQEQGEATQCAIETLQMGDMEGAAAHLRQAAGHINAGQYADSITDSIHAVESVARKIDPNSNTTLGQALNSLERAGVLKHRALKQAFNNLYGYTNTEEGIRHALLNKSDADVGIDEALFMFGACASFSAYLSEKHRQVGQHHDGDG